jgi:hypothetical protein
MRTLLLLALALFSSCGPDLQPRLRTRCGVEYLGSYPDGLSVAGWNDLSLQRVEDVTVEILNKRVHNDKRFSQFNICQSLQGVRLLVYPEKMFPRAIYTPQLKIPERELTKEELEHTVGGISDCFNGIMVLSNVADGRPLWSAFGHETAHFTQNCSPRITPGAVFKDDDDASHSNWDTDGIFDAADEIHLQ